MRLLDITNDRALVALTDMSVQVKGRALFEWHLQLTAKGFQFVQLWNNVLTPSECCDMRGCQSMVYVLQHKTENYVFYRQNVKMLASKHTQYTKMKWDLLDNTVEIR